MVCFFRIVTSPAKAVRRSGESRSENVKVQTTSHGPPLNIGTKRLRRWLGRTEDRHADLGNFSSRRTAAWSSGSGFLRRGRLRTRKSRQVLGRRGGVLAWPMSCLSSEWWVPGVSAHLLRPTSISMSVSVDVSGGRCDGLSVVTNVFVLLILFVLSWFEGDGVPVSLVVMRRREVRSPIWRTERDSVLNDEFQEGELREGSE
jgi:hypothetical protein